MRYLILFILTISSLCSAEQVYWKAGSHSAPTANAAAKALCDWNTICSSFTIEPYRSNPSRHDLLTVVYYSDSVNYPVWKVDNIRMLSCGYDDFSVCSTFDHEQNVTVCSDGFYSNAGNLIGYVNTCDRPELKECNDGSFKLFNSFCPMVLPVCSDYETCYAYALSQMDCSNSTNVEFIYLDSENFSYSCDRVDPVDPDQVPDPDWFGCSSQTGLCGGIDSVGSSSSSSQSSASTSSISSSSSSEHSSSNDGSGSSASASSAGGGGSGSSAGSGSGECDPTAKNYLECLGTKELEIPTEGGSFDGVGTNSEDRIAELEGELNDLINQVTAEINDSIGVTLSGSGGLSDYTYSIKGVSVSFGWTRFASYLSLLGYAIIAAAYVAAFIIIMRH